MAIVIVSLCLFIALGYWLNKVGLLDSEGVDQIDKLTYYVFFPALIFEATATADFGFNLYATAVSFSLFFVTFAFLVAFISTRIRFLDAVGLGNSFQLTARQNGVISLYVITGIFGNEGIALAGLLLAPLILFLNLVTFSIFTITSRQPPSLINGLKTITLNPFIIAAILGLFVGLLSHNDLFQVPSIISIIVGNAADPALVLGLLSVGFSIASIQLSKNVLVQALSFSFLRLILMPIAFSVFISLFFESTTLTLVSFIVFSAPTATASYIVSRRFADDNETALVSVTILTQTLIAVITMPLAYYFFQAFVS